MFAIVFMLLLVFFNIEHDLRYTTRGSGFGFSEAETELISYGDSAKQRLILVLFLFSVLIFPWRERISLVFRDPLGCLILLNVAWAAASIFWAENPSIVSRRVLLLLIVNFVALSLAANVPLKKLPVVVFWFTATLVSVGFLCERLLHTWWFRDPDYRFSGTCHPEAQAMSCAMLVLAAVAMARRGGPLGRATMIGAMFFGMTFLLLTKSRGPFIGLIIAYIMFQMCIKKRSKLLTYFFVAVIFLGIFVIVLGDMFLPALGAGVNLGRQESLTGLSGRLELWNELTEYVRERPLLGSGLGGFWTEDRVLTFADSHRWRVRDSHSIYFETILDLGFIGLMILVALLTVAGWRAWRMGRDRRDEGAAFALSLIALSAADGLWSSLVVGRGFNTLLLLIVLFGLTFDYERRPSRADVASDDA
jgi:O-antigen ligase